ncbi:hypothetical protein GCT13_14770 [Paraburkholderia sp. CNPSo 3157]|uniref:Uncharacterized protein n=1 Tax=Paraburkholderia franconis TaxID=2654983 RepID=A0A7X1TGF3_9BURK|nr:hypothetical protein [Paraburkholderia franconis]MPW18149.1 hypothetical protein [Paraburkholderia franconis]
MPTYPGIYIQELHASAHTNMAAPTSITVFIGYTHPFKTPPNNFGIPVPVFSFSDYEDQFGGFFQSSVVDCNVARAVNDFFLNGGAHAYVVSTNSGMQYSTSNGSNHTEGCTLGNVEAAFNNIGPGIKFIALEPTDIPPAGTSPGTEMTVEVSNVQGNTADITIKYANRSETFRKLMVDAGDPDVLNKSINGISTLITVAPAGANYPGRFTAGTATLKTTVPANAVGAFNVSNFRPLFAAEGALDKLQIFNLMAMPGIVNNSVLSDAIAFCKRRMPYFRLGQIC